MFDCWRIDNRKLAEYPTYPAIVGEEDFIPTGLVYIRGTIVFTMDVSA
jgi:hypothetical protein